MKLRVPCCYSVATMVLKKKTEMVRVRVTEEELAAWSAVADKEQVTLSDWIRQLCRAALPKPKKK